MAKSVQWLSLKSCSLRFFARPLAQLNPDLWYYQNTDVTSAKLAVPLVFLPRGWRTTWRFNGLMELSIFFFSMNGDSVSARCMLCWQGWSHNIRLALGGDESLGWLSV